MCTPNSSREKKSPSVSVVLVKESEEEFLSGARMPDFSSMLRLRFLSEASWEIFIFVFLYFVSCVFYLSFLCYYFF